MVKTILSTSHCNLDPGTTVAGTTEFWLFGYTSFEKSTTESTREVIWRSPGTLSKLYVRLTANTTSTNGSVTIRKNGADTALTVTVTAGSGAVELEDTSDTVSVAAGDKLCIETVSGGTGTFTMTMVSCIWDATTNCNVRYVAKGYSVNQASATNYLPIAGDRSGTTGTEANVENTIKTVGTIKNGSVNVTSNARTNNTVFAVRKNRADTTMVITVGSGATGHREDTTNSISYAVDNEIDWRITTLTGTPALVANSLAVDYETTTSQGVLTRGCVGSSADFIVDSTVTWYAPIGGGNREGVTTESQVQMKAREAFTFRNLIVYTNTNNITSNSVIKFRVNGADSGISVTIGAAGTGFFPDTTNTVTVAAGDLINFQFVMGGAAAQSMSVRQLSITTDAPAAGNNITKSLATETVSISEAAFTRLSAKIRTRTDTAITVGESRARLSAKMRPIATQVTTLSENVIRIKGKVKSLATETVTVTGGTIARLLAKIRTPAPETTTISETRQRLGSKSRPLPTQSLALSESTQRIKGLIRALATQTITVGGGTLARLGSKIRTISQTTVIADAGGGRLKGSMRTTAAQTVTLSENIALAIARQVVRALATQTITVAGGDIARLKTSQRIISQTIILSDTRNRLAVKLRALAAQTITIADNIARLVEAPTGITRSLSQTVVLSETVGRRLVAQRLLSQTVPMAESLARVRGVLKSLLQTILLSESRSRIKSASRTLSQTVLTSENLSKLNTITRSISQTTSLAENVIIETTGFIVRSLVETITVSDNIARRMAKFVILDQTIVIIEQASRISAKLRTIPTQTITLADSTIAELNVIIKNVIKTISEIVSISEYLKFEHVHWRERFRKILQPSIKRLISNHPAWLLGTRGPRTDHFEEFAP